MSSLDNLLKYNDRLIERQELAIAAIKARIAKLEAEIVLNNEHKRQAVDAAFASQARVAELEKELDDYHKRWLPRSLIRDEALRSLVE